MLYSEYLKNLFKTKLTVARLVLEIIISDEKRKKTVSNAYILRSV